jgi:hypothetical protein
MKNLQERLKEMLNIYEQLRDLGLDEQVCPSLTKFKKDANDFIKEGVSISGKVKMHEIDRDLVYVLSTQDHITSHAKLVLNQRT